jgi:hypothetical protein
MGRTITKTFAKRMEAQFEEAKNMNHQKVAKSLGVQLEKYASFPGVRTDDSDYFYLMDDLRQNVEDHLWDAAVRIQDYYGAAADPLEIQAAVDDYAEQFIESIRIKTGKIIGAYEPKVPGEQTTIEVEDDG